MGAFDGAILVKDVMEALEQGEAAVRSRIEEELANEDVSWDYEQVTGPVANLLIKHASLTDMVVTGREAHSSKARWTSQVSLIGDLLHRCRTPLYIPPADGSVRDPTGPALIAWDGSFEAANAVRSSVEFLKAASSVIVLEVRREEEGGFPNTRLLEYLSRRGIHAEMKSDVFMREETADVIVGEAAQAGASTIVMGSHNHSRIGELVFGGVTRTLLLDCPVALLMAH